MVAHHAWLARDGHAEHLDVHLLVVVGVHHLAALPGRAQPGTLKEKEQKIKYYLRRAIQQHLWKSRGQGKPSLFEWITIEKILILKKPVVPSLLPFASTKKRLNTPWADNSMTWKEEKDDSCCVPHGPAQLKLPHHQHRLCAFIHQFKVVLQFSGADKIPRQNMQLN